MLFGMVHIQPHWWVAVFFVALVQWRGKRERIVTALLSAYLFLILVVTVLNRHGPIVDPYGKFQLIPFWSYVQAARERSGYILKQILLNYAIFVPAGALMQLRGFRIRTAVLCGFAFSLGIEILQLILRLGLFEIDDILGNAIGCLIGAVLSRCIRRRITERRK